jgi:hypothetical protein
MGKGDVRSWRRAGRRVRRRLRRTSWLTARGSLRTSALGTLARRQVGGAAQEWTAAELRRLPSRTWRVLHDVPTRYGNVGHVVIGPGRVYAIETKWTASEGKFLDGACGQADRQAQELRSLLTRRGAGREVIPILIVWGPRIGDALGELPTLRGDTRVVAGRHCVESLERMARGADRVEVDWHAFQAVRQAVLAGEDRGNAA